MSDEKFWIMVWSVILSGLLAITITLCAFSYAKRVAFYEAIKNGADALDIGCVYSHRDDSDIILQACAERIKIKVQK